MFPFKCLNWVLYHKRAKWIIKILAKQHSYPQTTADNGDNGETVPIQTIQVPIAGDLTR